MRPIRSATAVIALCLAAGCTNAGRDSDASPSAVPTATRSRQPSSPSPARTPSPRPGPPRLEVVGRFDQPVYVTAPPGDPRLFVVEKSGRVRVRRDGRVLAAPFLDVSGEVSTGSEQGLLSIAFAPDYGDGGQVYVYYTDRRGDTRVVEWTVRPGQPDQVDPATRRELLHVRQPYQNHNGGLLLFDPTGMLLVGLGDGGAGGDPGNRAQNLGTLLGKLLRIDPRASGSSPYAVPSDNPFVGRAGARGEVWAYGLRNPWRFTFDAPTGDLYVADVGQRAWEEVNVVPPPAQSGANYGWRAFEGNERYVEQRIDESRLVRPRVVYDHEGGRCSVTGGMVYRGGVTRLAGRYLYGDYCSGEVWSVPAGTTGGAPAPRREPFSVEQLSSFGMDGLGEAYVMSLGGSVWRITA